MIVDLRLRKYVQDFAFVEGFQVLPLANCAITARRVSADLFVVSLFQGSTAFSIENIDHFFRKRCWWRWDDPSGEAVYAEHWQDHSLAARHRASSESYLRRNLEGMEPDLRFPLLEFLNASGRLLVHAAWGIIPVLSLLIPLANLDGFPSAFLVF